MTFAVFSNNDNIHQGKVVGSIPFGSLVFTTVLDEVTSCIIKTSPHSQGVFEVNDVVSILRSENSEVVEILKPGLTERIFANKSCLSEDQVEKLANGDFDKVTVSCSGSCDCSLGGVLNNNEWHVACSCDQCTMTVRFSPSRNQSNPNENQDSTITNDERIVFLQNSKMQIPFISDFMSDFPDSKLNKIEFNRNKDDYFVTFFYSDESDSENTVTFARAQGNTYKIQCTGDCGCREIYYFETNSAACSCDTCTMTVEHVQPK